MDQQAERRQATVLFAEVSGFDALAERMPAEELTEIMNACFERMGAVITAYEGRIDKFIGETVMAVFGAPVAVEGAPARALRATLVMRETVQVFCRERDLAVPLRLRAGVNTGTVLAGAVGTREQRQYTVMGDTVNLASRLQGLAELDRILVGPGTHRATVDDFAYRRVGPVDVKGKAHPVLIHELLSERTGAGTRRAERGRSRMVGRGRELSHLAQAVRDLREGQGGLVLVSGEAGIGKSRLLAELQQLPICAEVTVLEGRGLSMGRNLSFHPFVDLFRNWARLTDQDRDDLAVRKLSRLLGGIDPDSRAEVLPFILTLMGLPVPEEHAERMAEIEAEGLERKVQRTVGGLLARASAARPLLLCFEDLHWADASTLELLGSLAPITERHPILLMLVFRPGYDDVLAPLYQAIESDRELNHSIVSLQPLDATGSQQLMDGLLPVEGLPAALRASILERSGGNPYFIEEVLRGLVDQGAVEQRPSGWVVTDRIADIEIPMSISDVIMARIDRLEPSAREVLRTASVLGRAFFYRVLADLLPSSGGLAEHLEVLVDSQILRHRTRQEELEYLFKHALAQEVAYSSLLLPERRELHLRAAHAIESTFAHRLSDFYGMLAWHYSCAEELDQAEEYMLKAGQEATRASASSEALHYYQRALELYSRHDRANRDPARLVRIEESLGRTLVARGHMEEALGYLGRALAHLGVPRPRTRLGALLKLAADLGAVTWRLYVPRLAWSVTPSPHEDRIAELFFVRGAALGAVDPIRFFSESIEGTRRILRCGWERVAMGAETLSTSSIAFSWTGISTALSARILAQVQPARLNQKQSLYYRFGDLCHRLVTGAWDLPYDDELIEYGVQVGALFAAAGCAVTWGLFLIERGEFAVVGRIIDTLTRLADEYNDKNALSFAVKLRSQLACKRRDLIEVEHIEEGLEANLLVGQDARSVPPLAWRALARVVGGRLDEAEVDLRRAEALAASGDVTPHDAAPLHEARLALALARWEQARRGGSTELAGARATLRSAARQAERNARKVPAERVAILRLLGSLAWLEGDHAAALRRWRQAIAAGEALGARPELALTWVEVAERLEQATAPAAPKRFDTRDARACRAEAERIQEDLGEIM
ncbi:MAG: adenylate/guanylate cyclase domain-containing protein [Pseudomonadota bacterium]